MQKAKPTLFIGSSAEGLPLAQALEAGLATVADVTVWDQGIFDLTESTLTSLLHALDRFRFGVFVLSSDDTVRIRQKEMPAARDNVIFESGLFLGRLGPGRTFFLLPLGYNDLRLPSDLLGRTAAVYDSTNADFAAAVAPACKQIRRAIAKVEVSAFGKDNEARLDELEQRINLKLVRLLADAERHSEAHFPHNWRSFSRSDVRTLARLQLLDVPGMIMGTFTHLALSFLEAQMVPPQLMGISVRRTDESSALQKEAES